MTHTPRSDQHELLKQLQATYNDLSTRMARQIAALKKQIDAEAAARRKLSEVVKSQHGEIQEMKHILEVVGPVPTLDLEAEPLEEDDFSGSFPSPETAW